jgi:hypothetical protein
LEPGLEKEGDTGHLKRYGVCGRERLEDQTGSFLSDLRDKRPKSTGGERAAGQAIIEPLPGSIILGEGEVTSPLLPLVVLDLGRH